MLFKTTEKIKEYADVSSLNLETAKVTITSVQEQHIKPLLGATLYNNLVSAYTSETNENSLPDAYKKLLHKCRQAIGPYFCYYYQPSVDGVLSQSGFQRMETNNAKTAFQYQVNNYRDEQLRKANVAMESLLEFLEENKGNYSQWVEDAAFKAYRNLFIRSAKEFAELYFTASPYRTFYAVRFKMYDVEELYIREKIGDDLFDVLKQKDKDAAASFSDDEEIVMKRLKKAIAYYTMGMALPYLQVTFDERGLTVTGTGTANRDKDAKALDAPTTKTAHLERNAIEAGNIWLSKAVDYIQKNAGAFPAYKQPETKQTTDTGNSQLKSTFSFS